MLHSADKHHLLSPYDLWWHLEEEHGVQASERVSNLEAHFVKSWLEAHGIESTGDLATDRLVVWHERTHADDDERDPENVIHEIMMNNEIGGTSDVH